MRVLSLSMLLILTLISCRKKEDAFYGRPDSLESPIYGRLQEKGNFNTLLKLIDKSGYKETLESGAGYWTFLRLTMRLFQPILLTKALAALMPSTKQRPGQWCNICWCIMLLSKTGWMITRHLKII
ncbi:hypothetical protein LWM68_14905 [Niabella sp. W65]|nr:hypothetical protein [Niabella sp. W65]MCH7363933.1 hypothetical protein [Niabella sp. W65]